MVTSGLIIDTVMLCLQFVNTKCLPSSTCIFERMYVQYNVVHSLLYLL